MYSSIESISSSPDISKPGIHAYGSARGYTSPDRNDLPYVIFSSTGIKVVTSPSNIYTREASRPPKGATTYSSNKIGQRLADKPCPLAR
jgi:hypothetical protein